MIETSDPTVVIYSCGCANQSDDATGALRRISICEFHSRFRRIPEELGKDYYEEIGLIKNGEPQSSRYMDEFEDALGEIPGPLENSRALEVGCGASPYVSALTARGWSYSAIEPSLWAAEWMRRTYDVPIIDGRIEHVTSRLFMGSYGLIMAAHTLEHVADAPAVLAIFRDLLCVGGQLMLIVPDDTDPVNPDHDWFFTVTSLRRAVEATGLFIEKSAVRNHSPIENYLYLRATKQ